MGWGLKRNGCLFAFVGIFVAVIQGGLTGKLANRYGEIKLIVQGATALALGMLFIPFTNTHTTLFGAIVIVAYGFSIITPSLNSLISI